MSPLPTLPRISPGDQTTPTDVHLGRIFNQGHIHYKAEVYDRNADKMVAVPQHNPSVNKEHNGLNMRTSLCFSSRGISLEKNLALEPQPREGCSNYYGTAVLPVNKVGILRLCQQHFLIFTSTTNWGGYIWSVSDAWFFLVTRFLLIKTS